MAWLTLIPQQPRDSGNPGRQSKWYYKDVVTAFDIETTRLADIEQSFMYVWMWSFGNEYVVIGRTWEQFELFMERIRKALKPRERISCWIHNASYEFCFLRGIHNFKPDEVFAIRPRKVLSFKWDPVDFKCSYLHANMNLAEYTKKMGVEHKKLSGDEFDYSKIRYPWTELSEFERQYCIHDVVGLVEALTVEMTSDHDNFYKFPPTSTGYVRRDVKAAMRMVSYQYIQQQLPDLHLFEMLREGFRGGDVHANRYYVGQIVENVKNRDRSSSYPDIVCNCPFPVSPFKVLDHVPDWEEIEHLMLQRGRAIIMRVAIHKLELRDPTWPAPYLSKDKCRNVVNGQYDNGRILCADYLETTITDVDLRIIVKEYKWSKETGGIVFYDVAHARYGPLPQPLIGTTIDYYRLKNELKNVPGQEIYYTKAKNKQNSIYGMMAQNSCRRKLVYTQDGVVNEYGEVEYFPEDQTKTDEEILADANRRAFLCYQWGVWVTAWARYRLREGIWTIIEQGGEWLYGDTDSDKYIGDVNWEPLNAERIRDSKRSGAYATDPTGVTHYMGVFEEEHDYLRFRTWGAKKYAYETLSKTGEIQLGVTVAGVAKATGGRELARAGGLEAFKPGFVFRESGGVEAVFNDETDEWLEIDGHRLHITPNVSLRDSSYTLGLSGDFWRLLHQVMQLSIDIE